MVLYALSVYSKTEEYSHYWYLFRYIEFDFDIMKTEGQWWVDVNWIISYGLGVKMIKQKKDEAIVIGPGCLYWYESEGISTHGSWSILPKTINQSKILVSKLDTLK